MIKVICDDCSREIAQEIADEQNGSRYYAGMVSVGEGIRARSVPLYLMLEMAEGGPILHLCPDCWFKVVGQLKTMNAEGTL